MAGLNRYLIRDGDSIQQIARRLLGNADQWWVLVTFNDLSYPYVDTSGQTYPGRKVLTTGDVLLVPTDLTAPAVQQASAKQTASAAPDIYTVLLGVDMQVDATRDLTPDIGTGDLATLAGVSNLQDALRRRILTRKGELANHPEYGSNIEDYIGRVMDAANLSLLRLEILQTCLAEPRVRSVDQFTLQDQVDAVTVSALLRVIGVDDIVPLNLVIQRP